MKRMLFSEFDIKQMINDRKLLFVEPVLSTHHKNHFDGEDSGLTYVDFYDSNQTSKSEEVDMLMLCSDSEHWIGTLCVETGEWNLKPQYLVGEQIDTFDSTNTTEKDSLYYLHISKINLKRVQDITEAEAFYNGNERLITSPAIYDGLNAIQRQGTSSYEESFKKQWQEKWKDTIYNWDNNPYIFVFVFDLIHKDVE